MYWYNRPGLPIHLCVRGRNETTLPLSQLQTVGISTGTSLDFKDLARPRSRALMKRQTFFLATRFNYAGRAKNQIGAEGLPASHSYVKNPEV